MLKENTDKLVNFFIGRVSTFKILFEGISVVSSKVETDISKIMIEKEAYSVAVSLHGENQNSASFERTFVDGSIEEQDPIAYKFKVMLDKPANKDVAIQIFTEGIAEKYLEEACIDNACTDGGNIIIMNPQTGDILAMAGYPNYNLNHPQYTFHYLLELLIHRIFNHCHRRIIIRPGLFHTLGNRKSIGIPV